MSKRLKYCLSLYFVAVAPLFCVSSASGQEVTLIAPGGFRCAVDRLTPSFNTKTGLTLNATIGSGGGTHQQVVKGEAFDVPVVQPPYQDVIDSGNVIPSTETPLASVPVAAVIRKGDPRPDISTPEAVKKLLLSAKAISYPDGANGRGGAAGVSFDATLKKLGIYDQIQSKVKRVQGVALLKLLTNGDIDVAFTFPSEVNDPAVEVVGTLPAEISTPTALVAFISAHAKSPEGAKALLSYLASTDGAAAYRACSMVPAR